MLSRYLSDARGVHGVRRCSVCGACGRALSLVSGALLPYGWYVGV